MENKVNCLGFPPSINENCTILILGSMPGISSLKAQQYYAHPQNRFWKIMFRLLENTVDVPADYQIKLNTLLRHHIALWDSIDRCTRNGSLDSDIKNETGSDIVSLIAAYPNIKTICLNGAKSYQIFKRCNKELLNRSNLKIIPLPSTSPANARWTLDALLKEWGKYLSDRT